VPQGSIKETLSRVDPLDVWRILKSAGVKYVKPIIIDIHGRPRAELMPIDAAKDILTDGMPFDGSSIQSYATVNRATSWHYLTSDPCSLRVGTVRR